MASAQDGWLQLDQDPDVAIPVTLVAFSSRGVILTLPAEGRLQQGASAQLLTQAHGAGLGHRLVRCCWYRPHPQDPALQCAGMRFESIQVTALSIGQAAGSDPASPT